MVFVDGPRDRRPGLGDDEHSLDIVAGELLSGGGASEQPKEESQAELRERRDEEKKMNTHSRILASIPAKGKVADPGLVGIAPGRGVMTMDPVSVCQ